MAALARARLAECCEKAYTYCHCQRRQGSRSVELEGEERNWARTGQRKRGERSAVGEASRERRGPRRAASVG